MSLIRSLLLMEAPEELTLPAPSASAPVPAPGSPMSQTDFVPPAPGMGLGGPGSPVVAPSMPSSMGAALTVQKEVVNKEVVLSITGKLKSILVAIEKKYEKEDMVPEVSNIYLNELLGSLKSTAADIAALTGAAPAEESAPIEEPLPAAEAPIEEPLPAADEPMPEPVEPSPAPYSEYTPGEGEAPEASPFTSPTEAI